jgi:hypothetical protein
VNDVLVGGLIGFAVGVAGTAVMFALYGVG